MQVFKSTDGVRTLKAMTAAASSAQMLDLNAIAIACQAEREHAARPMFTHPVLNRAIVLKHSLRDDDASHLSIRGGAFATKLIFPFDHLDLDLGGQVLLLERQQLHASLTRHLDYKDADLSRDVRVLSTLARLPTLDPFLVRETLTQQRLAVAPCYFRLSDADREEMAGYVAEAVQSLIHACFGRPAESSARAERMSQILLAAEGGPELDPLRVALRMGAVEFDEAMFAWKGFLYYRWRSGEMGQDLRDAKVTIARISTRLYDGEWAPFITKAKAMMDRQLTRSVADINSLLGRYDHAFASLTGETPDEFREFLVEGPRLFSALGDRIGRLEQIISVCRHRLEPAGRAPDHVWDVVRDLLFEMSPASAGLPKTATAA